MKGLEQDYLERIKKSKCTFCVGVDTTVFRKKSKQLCGSTIYTEREDLFNNLLPVQYIELTHLLRKFYRFLGMYLFYSLNDMRHAPRSVGWECSSDPLILHPRRLKTPTQSAGAD